jgi:hypothetical protein
MIIIKRWNRFGNSVIQLINILHIAISLNHNIKELKKHDFFDIGIINNILNNKENNNIIQDNHEFFEQGKIKVPSELFKKNKEKVQEILEKSFIIQDIPALEKDDLVIHIRSGDIFDKKPHPVYVMPPFSYYKNIIDSVTYNNIILVAEDRKNPVIDKLLTHYPNIKFKIQSFYKDIQTILGAHNVISSFGTFIPYLLLLSKNIKNLYQPNYQGWGRHFKETSVNLHIIDLSDYTKKMRPWKNTPEQIEILLNYEVGLPPFSV